MARRLAAILAADVVGYSRLMGIDEAGTLAAFNAHRDELIAPKIGEYEGRIVKQVGDGLLAEFASAVNAVQCAAEIQAAMAERNAEVPEHRRITFRMGINLGDVIVEDDDIFGNGVNVAARLEGLADPGGIRISDDAYRQVRGKLDLPFTDLGTHAFKNIAEPVHVFGVGGLGTPTAPAHQDLPSKPSIAVLPFANLSDDAGQTYFADGITDEITTALSRVRWFFVIARNTSFTYKGRAVDAKQVARELGVRYLLEGSVRKAADRVRVTAQLIEGVTGNQIWAKRFDGELSDIFAVQDAITETIVGAIEPELGKVERARARSKKPGNLDAWDLYQRGMAHLYQYTVEDAAEAKRLFTEAIALDPNLGPAHSGLAETYYYEVVYGFAADATANRERALAPALRAVALDSADAAAHCTLGRVHYMRREHDAAIRELRTAVELNPSLALAHYGIGAALVFTGRAREAKPHLETAIHLSPYDPNMGSFLVRLADASYFVEDYDDAIEWAKRALQQPNFQWSRYTVLLAALGQLGRGDEAAAYCAELLRQRPDVCLAFVRDTHLIADPGSMAHYLDGLRKAGLPEATTS